MTFQEPKQEFFANKKGYGEFKDKWEFPSGKIEIGETSHQALIKEIQEKLDVTIIHRQLYRS